MNQNQNQNQNFVLYSMMEGQSIQQYRLETLLGAGGFGGVFRAAEVARDRVLRHVAIKLVSNTSDQQLEELNTAVSLDHPHFIRCFAAGECQVLRAEFLFLVMELAAGSLEQQLAQGAMAEAAARQLVQEVATALQLLHSQKKVHRDLKPGNVLLAQGRWKLADFGLVRQLGPSSYGQTSNPIGTIAFMPPEAFDGKISTAWDLWSLGIMTAGVLTGKLPYDYQDQTRLLKQVMNAAVQMPTLREPFGSIVRGCLNPDFRQRWTADQVLEALNPAQATQSRWNIDAVPLNSEKRVDYRRLLDLLKAGRWKEADQEAAKCMERALGTSDWYKIYSQKLLLQLPCADLKTIDQLWVQASQGRYGFSVQKEIYAKCGAKLDGNYPGDAIWYKFCEEVGWRVNNSWVSYSNLKWHGTGVPGHLPMGRGSGGRRLIGESWESSLRRFLFSRIETCRL